MKFADLLKERSKEKQLLLKKHMLNTRLRSFLSFLASDQFQQISEKGTASVTRRQISHECCTTSEFFTILTNFLYLYSLP